MQLLILAILVALVGAGQIQVGDDSSHNGDGSSDIGALQMKVGDDSSDSNVEVHVIKWEVRQTDQTEPPTELHIEPEPTSPLMRNPSRHQKRPRPRPHRTKWPKHVRMRMPKKTRTTTPETTTQRTTRKTKAKARRRGKTATDDWISHMRNSYKVFKNAEFRRRREKMQEKRSSSSIHSQ